jgi:hypothetical protein
MYGYTYIRTYTHAYIHTYINTYIPTYSDSNVNRLSVDISTEHT